MIIYSDSSNAKDIFDEELARKYPIWVAEYGVREPSNNGKWETCDFRLYIIIVIRKIIIASLINKILKYL